MSNTPTSIRFSALDGVRGIAAIAVVLFHFSESSGEPWLQRAWLAVDVFVCMSGFVIAHSYQQKIADGMSFTEFVRRRMSRLYPLYLFGLLAGATMFLAASAFPAGYNAITFAKTFALGLLVLPYLNDLATVQGAGKVVGLLFPFNGPSWSMFFELAANAAFFALLFLRVRRWWLVAGVCALLFLWMAQLGSGVNAGWNARTFAAGFPRIGYSFFAGVALYRLHDITRVGLAGQGLPAILLMLVVFALPGSKAVSVAGCLALGPIIVWANAAAKPGPHLTAVYRFLGWISYPLYIVHVPVFQALSMLAPAAQWTLPVWAVISAKTGVAILCASCVAWLDDVLRQGRNVRRNARTQGL
jgi:peptidoglycan/LPS O-acetylase OafA/YrhL